MDTQRNEFVELDDQKAASEPGQYIPFGVDEEVEIKGYRFRIVRVKVGMNELVMKPIGLARVAKDSRD